MPRAGTFSFTFEDRVAPNAYESPICGKESIDFLHPATLRVLALLIDSPTVMRVVLFLHSFVYS